MGRVIFNHELISRGFIPVIGTIEIRVINGKDVSSPVEADLRSANKWGRNNGVTVVYDHRGHPYVGFRELTPRDRYELGLSLRGENAYVPHSNDGGWWTAEHVPQHYEPPMSRSIV